MNKYVLLALLGHAAALKLRKGDLPDYLPAEKIDPLSRYVNDDDLVQRRQEVNLAQALPEDTWHQGQAHNPNWRTLSQQNALPEDTWHQGQAHNPNWRTLTQRKAVPEDTWHQGQAHNPAWRTLVQLQAEKGDLPDYLTADKIDPLSRYENDDDLVQYDPSDVVLMQIKKGDLPDYGTPEKIDYLSRYENDDDLH